MQMLLTQTITTSQTDLAPLIAAIKHILHSSLDPAFIAYTLTLPTERAIAQTMPTIEVDFIHHSHQALLKTLAIELEKDWLTTYQRCQAPFALDAKSMAKRRLKNTALSYLIATGKPAYVDLAFTQFETAQNMTDKAAAFMALLNGPCNDNRQKAIDAFYQEYKNEPLTLNKWFQYQASSTHTDTADHVAELINHPDFTFDNPNKVYALLLHFSANQAQFHRADGKGYEIVQYALEKLNSINPQVASRLAKSLMNFKQFESSRQTLMQKTLEALMQQDLCKDVYEVVSKALNHLN
jgi:aminopeptidase N